MMHEIEPVASVYWPEGQSRQLDACEDGLYILAEHFEQRLAPPTEYRPGAQLLHSAEPARENIPAAQIPQED
jgi:hypothetical protein